MEDPQPRISVRVPATLKERVEHEADRRLLNLSAVVRHLLEVWVERSEVEAAAAAENDFGYFE